MNTWFQYSQSSRICDKHQTKVVAEFSFDGERANLNKKENILPDKIQKDLCGLNLRIAAGNTPPLVTLKDQTVDTYNIEHTDGMEMKLFHCLGQKLNLSITIAQNTEDYP